MGRGAAPDEALADTIASDPGPSTSTVSASTPDGRRASERIRDAETSLSDAPAGTRLDHFRLLRKLGQGGMGTVYVAHDESLDRQVAIKVLRDELTRRPEHEDRFLREARAQARLNHPNVVHIYYIGRSPPRPDGHRQLFFAMELIGGRSLESVLDHGQTLDPETARRYMIQVAQGLRAAWKAGIVHRDVKPANLMVEDGYVKIADFGLAKPVEDEGAHITQQGAMVGSPLYMAPEQARGHHVDFHADMYALGATFHHLLAGKPPFEGRSSLAVIAQHLSEPAPPLRTRAPHVPEPLARIVDRLLAKKPEDRFASYDALIAALEAAAPRTTSYAGFWTRAAAVLIDSALAGGLIALIGWPAIPLHLLYVTVAIGLTGQTIAKALLNVRVTRLDGSRLGLPRALARTLVSLWMPIAAGITILRYHGMDDLRATIEQLQPHELGAVQELVVAIAVSHGFLTLLYAAGLLLAAFHPQKRALHDLLVGSVATYRLRAS
ncbi:MAG: protein kinase [Myxococcota bacterium]|nr:protein kinase [Myxococcota bacterium]